MTDPKDTDREDVEDTSESVNTVSTDTPASDDDVQAHLAGQLQAGGALSKLFREVIDDIGEDQFRSQLSNLGIDFQETMDMASGKTEITVVDLAFFALAFDRSLYLSIK